MYDWPLMENNVSREDLDILIEYLKQDNPRLTQGEQVSLFEQEWSDWLGVNHSIFVNSGSSANFITMQILHDEVGDGEIIVSPLNWVSDIVAAVKAGFNLRFVDINMETLGLDTDAVIEAINRKTKGILLTHIMGYNALTNSLLSNITDCYGNQRPFLIEDVCESPGAVFNNKKCGTFGLMSNFSFYFAHHMSTIEGGMICCNDDDTYQRALMYRSHGMLRECSDINLKDYCYKEFIKLNKDFIFMYPAYNMRSTEINAIIGRNQLKRLDKNIEIRNKNNNMFNSYLDENKYYKLNVGGASNYAFVVITKDLKLTPKVIKLFEEKGIEYRQGLSGGGNQLLQPYFYYINNYSTEILNNIHWVHNNGFYFGNYPILETSKIYDLTVELNKL